MALVLDDITLFVRSLIGETTEKYWSEEEIDLYIKMGISKVMNEFLPFMWERMKTWTTISTVSGTAVYDPPTDYLKISHIQDSETGKKLRYISEDEYYKYRDWDDGDDAVWTWKGGQIMLIPTPASSATDKYIVWYVEEPEEITDIPNSLRALIGVEAVVYARTKNEDITPDILVMRKNFYDAAMVEATMTNMHQVDVFPDFDEESGLV